MLKLTIATLVVAWMCGLLLLGALADHISWKIAILETVATGLLGVAVIRYLSSRLERRVVAKLVAGEFLGDALVDAILIFLGGVLLVLPGLLSDAAGLLLLIPPVRWLIVALLRRWNLAHARAMREEAARRQSADASDVFESLRQRGGGGPSHGAC